MTNLLRILLFPKDLLLELEYWAQTGDYELEELEEVNLNLFFTIVQNKNIDCFF